MLVVDAPLTAFEHQIVGLAMHVAAGLGEALHDGDVRAALASGDRRHRLQHRRAVLAVAERLGVAYSTAKENINRIRVKYVEVGRPAPTKIDLLRRAMEDGLVEPDGTASVG